jgi:capsular exopolysaccharide family
MITKPQKDEFVNIVELLQNYKRHWCLFLGSIVLCLLFAVFYLKVKEPVYQINANVLITEDESPSSGGGLQSAMLKSFSFGGMLGGSSVDDELLIISSHSLIKDVVKDLNLNIDYKVKKGLFYKTAYKDLPIRLMAPESLQDTLSVWLKFDIRINKDNKADVKVKKGRFTTLADIKGATFPVTVKTVYGQFVVDTASGYKPDKNYKIKATIASYDSFTELWEEKISIGVASKKANGISLSLEETSIDRGKDLLNTLIAFYNEAGQNEKNVTASNTGRFIENRLSSLYDELSVAEKNVEEYKKQHNLTDLEIEAKVMLEQNGEFKQKLIEAETQLSVISMVDNFLRNTSNKYELVPITSGLPDKSAGDAIKAYNDLLLRRLQLLRTAGESNQSVQNLNEQIDAMRGNVLQTITKAKESYEIVRDDLQQQENIFMNRIKGMPTQEREFLELKRQQIIKSELYVFLLQKKEENSLMMAASVPKGRIIDDAYHLNEPLSPKRMMVILFAFFFGLLLPIIYLYLKDLFTFKFGTKQELKKLTNIPVVGEICMNESTEYIVAKKGDRSSIGELFRLLRANLQFLLHGKNENVILMTSSISGEGKSFVSVNLALSLALTNKKILLVGLDIRSPKLMDYLGMHANSGITSYLASDSVSIDDIINHTKFSEMLDVIFSGPVPPNPAELLLSERLDSLFSELKKRYDYIIVDSAPVGMVSDTFTLMRIADAVIYVCRANYTRKDNIAYVNDLVESGKLKNVSLVINGTTAKQGYGYGYGK